jgi:transposase
MISIAPDGPSRKVIIGFDTHKHVHVAVAIDTLGARLGDLSVSADTGGYGQIEAWSRALGRVQNFGVEDTGSYGAGLTSFLRHFGHRAIEVNRGDRRTRRQNGKSDTVDAEAAARSVLAGTATSIPKAGDGLSEMIRQTKVARDTARKGRTSRSSP